MDDVTKLIIDKLNGLDKKIDKLSDKLDEKGKKINKLNIKVYGILCTIVGLIIIYIRKVI